MLLWFINRLSNLAINWMDALANQFDTMTFANSCRCQSYPLSWGIITIIVLLKSFKHT
jgi:hypothetical protein